MIPQTISTDEVRAFKSFLKQQSFDFDQNFKNDEVLAQVLSAWKEWKEPSASEVLKEANEKLASALIACKTLIEQHHGFERLDQLKKEN